MISTVEKVLFLKSIDLFSQIPGEDLSQIAPCLGLPEEKVRLVLAGVVWLWLSSIVVLAGGVLNAELARAREGRAEPRTAD